MSGIQFVYPRNMPYYNAAPMPGGKLIFSATGTSTPQDVFTTVALNVPHANPVVADSQGIWPPIFLTPTATYRVTLTGANDVQVGAPVDGVGAWPEDVATQSGENTFEAENTFTLGATNVTFPISCVSSAPGVLYEDTAAAADSGVWRNYVSADVQYWDITNDVGAVQAYWMFASRSANTITQVGLAATALSFGGNVSTPNTSASEVGFKGSPNNPQAGDYTLVLTDAGRTIYKASGGAGETITIPANASVAFPVGTIIRICNNGGGTLSVAITSDTLAHTAGAGTRTLADKAKVEIEKVASTVWMMTGSGIS